MMEKDKKYPKELVRLYHACRYSRDGFKLSWKDAGAFRLEVCLTPIIGVFSWFIAAGKIEFFILFASWLFVLLTELLNTAIEAVTDLACGGEYHDLAKKAKDCGSAAVSVAVIVFVFSVGIVLFN